MKYFFKYSIVLLLCLQTFNVCAQGLTVFGEYLYWNASEQSVSVWANAIATGNNEISYSTPNVGFDWSSGFRGGLAYELPHLWDVKLFWTHMPTSRSASYSANANEILTPEFFSGFLSGDFFTSASLNWQIAMNTIDLEISHAINVTPTLKLSPTMGVKEATINQTINTTWNATLFTLPVFTATEIVKNNFSGIGPSLGLEGQWNIYKELSVVGNFTTALLWGHWNINDTYSRPASFFGLHPAETINTSAKNTKLGTATFQYFVGLQWTHHDKYDLNFLLGYEMQFWANQLRVPTFQLLPLHGDLTLQGMTCGISLGF